TKYMNGTDDCGYMVTRLTIADLDAIEPHEAEYFGIAMCTCGKARMTINLDVHDMGPNDVAIFSPKDMVHSESVSEDFCLKVIFITHGSKSCARQQRRCFPSLWIRAHRAPSSPRSSGE
ncbi:MAG: AraC family ligand binding domain-containing protein, partial [Bacteroidaceae bacterium]|nr:AraC family ligand binding domain-containing protein [Bacteroidaceae bacterium]